MMFTLEDVNTSSTLLHNATPVPHNATTLDMYATPQHDPLYIVIPMTVIYVVIFLSGVVGNVITCIVIARNKHMHTATNYYLFSLAVSDLLLLVSGLPQEMYYIWSRYPYVFGEVFCVLQGFAAETSANATVLTITAFTVERYVAICHPFLSHNFSKLSRAVRLIVAIWLLALALAVPQAIQFGIVYSTEEPNYSQCTVKWVLIKHAFEISTVVFFIGPMTLITVLYILIGLKLRRSRLLTADKRASIGSGNETSRGVTSTQNYVIKMLVAVVVGFFICWAPFHAQRLLAMYGNPANKFTYAVYSTLTYISGILYYLSTSINPLLYHIMSHKFRQAFKITLHQMLGRGRKHASYSHRQNYSMVCRCGPPNPRHGSNDGSHPRHRQLSVTEHHCRAATLGRRNNSVPSSHADTQACLPPRKLQHSRLPLQPTLSMPGTDPHSYPVFTGRKRGGSESSQITMTTSLGKLSLEGRGTGTPGTGIGMRYNQRSKQGDSEESASISNSSLQDMDGMEFCEAELAQYMGELNKR